MGVLPSIIQCIDLCSFCPGRPFIVELTNPKRVNVAQEEVTNIQKVANDATKDIQIRDLQIVSRWEKVLRGKDTFMMELIQSRKYVFAIPKMKERSCSQNSFFGGGRDLDDNEASSHFQITHVASFEKWQLDYACDSSHFIRKEQNLFSQISSFMTI